MVVMMHIVIVIGLIVLCHWCILRSHNSSLVLIAVMIDWLV